MHTKKASILVFTLWVLSFLTIVGLGLAAVVSNWLLFADHLQDRLKMYQFAKAGIAIGLSELEQDETMEYDGLNESWSNNEKLFKDFSLGQGYFTLHYKLAGEALASEENSGEEQELYGIMDELSKVNINKVPVSVLKSLLVNIGELEPEEAADIANSIIDWRDVDNIVSPGGAEDDYYQSLEQPYPCKNASFQAPEELLLVKGVTPELFSKIKDIITIYGQGKINVNTIGWRIFYALGLNQNLAQKIIDFRKGNDKQDGTEDDKLFKSTADIRNIGPLFTQESQEINSLLSLEILTVKTDTFRFNSQGSVMSGKQRHNREINCVVITDGNKKNPKILYWHEN